MKSKQPKRITFLSPDCREVEKLCYELAEKIRESNYNFDIIVAIGRGGWVPARYLADYLGNIMNVSHMKIEHYVGIAKTTTARITEEVSTNVRGKRILLVDDVPDTGDSVVMAKKYLLKKGAKEVRVACIHYKPWSTIKPEYFIKMTKCWVIYPWMRKENLEELKKLGADLKKTKIPMSEVKRLLKI